ncbi:MAG: VOC family protein [Planctomycetota bacterium]|nr:VOC family protein [Planctomycetota bacterium]
MTPAILQTPPITGVFCRNELNTRDPEKAGEFFRQLCGWTTEKAKLGEFDYQWFRKDGVKFGGILDMSSPEWGEMPPHWMHYIAVDDCKACVEKVKELGGKICYEGMEVPGICTFAVISDPTGGTFTLYQSHVPMDIGDGFAWIELMTRDVEAAVNFYTQLFGWTTQTMPMGDEGEYTIFMQGDTRVGGCLLLQGEQTEKMPTTWFGYIGTDDCDRDAIKAEQLGATIEVPPTDIPGVGRFFFFIDPTGAHCAMYQAKAPA